jgi:hypothetical protein
LFVCFQRFQDYDVPPEVEKMTNNGHSVTFTIEPAADMDYPKVKNSTQKYPKVP